MNFIKKFNFEIAVLSIILVFSVFLRLWNLGYSNYQGDEVKAFYNFRENKSFTEFFLDQRKGPNQFLVTASIRNVSNNYLDSFITRLPFSVANILSIFIFYFISKKLFNSKVAMYSTIFYGSSGFIVAFARIVQYQSFVILFGLITVYLGILFNEQKKIKYLYLGFISLAIAILFHYDGVFFGIPFGLIILQNLISKNLSKKTIFNIFGSGILFALILSSFYIPFLLSLDSETVGYFQERISGVGGENKISSSVFNFNLYQPYFSFYIYIFFGILGIYALLKNYKDISTIILVSWVLGAFIFMEVLIKSPGTHIYTYLIPLMLILGLGIEKFLELFKNKFIKSLALTFIFLISIHLFLQSYILFIENSKEYPWQDKRVLYFDLKSLNQDINQKYYLSVFGFPYNRSWIEIGEFLKDKNGTYDSSEKSSIANFYVPHLKFNNGNIYIEVEKPQSFSRANRKQFTPVKVFENPNGTKSYIYFIN